MSSTLLQQRPLLGALLNTLILLTLGLFLFGIFAPLIQVRHFYIFGSDISVYGLLVGLYRHGDWFLFGIILGFSLLFPLAKILLLGAAVNLPGNHRQGPLHWVALLGKWSMLDVFVVAVLVVSLKVRGLSEIMVQPGAWAFGISVLLSMGLVQWLRRLP